MLVGVTRRNRLIPSIAVPITLESLETRHLQHLVVVELRLEVFAVAEEIEELERSLIRFSHPIRDAEIKQLVEEVVSARTPALNLNKIRR